MDPYALPPGHTGAAQDHPSPTKRRRVAPPPPSSSSSVDPLVGPVTILPAPPGSLQPAQTAVHIQPPPLATLPAPLALLSLAVSLRASAHALLPSLAKRPSASSNSSQARYAHAWADYSRLQHALVAVLRAAVTLTATASEYAGGRLELRACAMLAQQLVDMYDGSGHEKIVAPEADRALARAVRSLHSLLSVSLPARELTRPPCFRGLPTHRSPSHRARVPVLLRLCPPRLRALTPLGLPTRTAPLTRALRPRPLPPAPPPRPLLLQAPQVHPHHPAPPPRVALLALPLSHRRRRSSSSSDLLGPRVRRLPPRRVPRRTPRRVGQRRLARAAARRRRPGPRRAGPRRGAPRLCAARARGRGLPALCGAARRAEGRAPWRGHRRSRRRVAAARRQGAGPARALPVPRAGRRRQGRQGDAQGGAQAARCGPWCGQEWRDGRGGGASLAPLFSVFLPVRLRGTPPPKY